MDRPAHRSDTTNGAPSQAEHFEQLFRSDADPWHYRTSWYERRKRDVLMSALPHERYRRGFEPGCANGELTLRLAERCDELHASDGSEEAVARAAERIQGNGNVHLRQADVCEDWPAGAFDLIVFSELGYYLPEKGLKAALQQSTERLDPNGTFIACHWRGRFDDFLRDGTSTHRIIGQTFRREGWTCTIRHDEEDFLLEAWSPDARPVSELAREEERDKPVGRGTP